MFWVKGEREALKGMKVEFRVIQSGKGREKGEHSVGEERKRCIFRVK